MLHFYRKIHKNQEICFNVELAEPLNELERKKLKWLLSETFEQERFKEESFFDTQNNVVEIGPRLNFATAWSTNAVAICHACDLNKIKRIEKSRRYLLSPEIDREKFIIDNFDRMTECEYKQSLQSFDIDQASEKVCEVFLIEQGISALEKINKEMGLGMDDWDIKFYYNLFVNDIGRNPTNVECFQLGQANSEHSRHWFFKGKMIIDSQEMPENLFEIVKSTWQANPDNSVIAFNDNSSAIRGNNIQTILPKVPGMICPFTLAEKFYHITFSAETHNFPSGVAPVSGGETGTGGRIRDTHATGKGSLVVAGTAGFCVGVISTGVPTAGRGGVEKSLNQVIRSVKSRDLSTPLRSLPRRQVGARDDNKINDDESYENFPSNMASPLEIMIGESNGGYDYGNKFGEPCIQGFTRSFGLRLPNGERREWIKPIMFTGGIGQIDQEHIQKDTPEQGMLIIQIGGPAYRIGVGGGSASSMVQGQNKEELDFNAVQRGDAEMEQKMNRVVRTCVEMGDKNPILSIHDQGAGGPCNVITEIIDPAGGKIDIRQIKVGDKTMSVLEIWSAEYQERDALLLNPERLSEFQSICEREKVSYEVLGEVSGDGRVVVVDGSKDMSLRGGGTTTSQSRGLEENIKERYKDKKINDIKEPVNLELEKILGKMPQKTFELKRVPKQLNPVKLPSDLTIKQALKKIFRLSSVGSKGFLVRKVDRSVTGLIVQQQCCGPLQLPVSNVSVIAQSHFGKTGAATAVGEQPIKMLVNTKAGARMAVGEMLTNMVWAKITSIKDIKCSLNWMWAAKEEGEGAELYDAAVATRDLMIKLGVAVDGGKDSLSMAAKVGNETVKAPGQMVVSGYASVPDIDKIITPDIKEPGKSKLMFIDLSGGKNRLGGSALAQVFKQIGDTSPDVDDVDLLSKTFQAVQKMIDQNLILAGHDRSDGGLITCLTEMAMSGHCGIDVNISKYKDALAQLFSEELGLVIEYKEEIETETKITDILREYRVYGLILGKTQEQKKVIIRQSGEVIFDMQTVDLLQSWEATSDRLEHEQMNPRLAELQVLSHTHQTVPPYRLSFETELKGIVGTGLDLSNLCNERVDKPKIAILREEGSNGDREMTSAFYMAGFEPWDVNMNDLINGKISLDQFNGLVFVGGFSYADVLDSAKGWAGIIKFNNKLSQMFDQFYNRPDTFSLGVCNGCQLMALLGWVPWKGIEENKQPRFIRNASNKFESRWINVKINKSPAIMLKDMEDSILGVWVAHGEGRFYCRDIDLMTKIREQNLAPLVYVDDEGDPTEQYPFNPNTSTFGIASLCSPDGRHLAMMPHPERAFLKWQWPYMPEDWKRELKASPWLKMFQNAFEFSTTQKHLNT